MKLTKEMAEKIFSAKDYEEAKARAAEVGYEMSEQEDAELKKYFSKELSDEELDAVAGGYDKCVGEYKISEKFTEMADYQWVGGNVNDKYLCPNCGRPVHKGTFGMFYCDPCDESWFYEDKLKPNLKNWMLVNII